MLRFMKNKILIPLLILGALACFFSFNYGESEKDTGKKRQIILETVMKTIASQHFSPRAIDDSFSSKVFKRMFSQLDYDKKLFTAEDVAQLEGHEFQIDDEVKAGSIEFFIQFNEIFNKRLDNAEGYYKEILDQQFTFNTDDSIQLNGEQLEYAANETALKERWNKYLKHRVLAKYVDLKKDREKAKEKDNKDGDKTLAKKTDAELEKDARESVRKNHDNYFKRLRKFNENDRYASFINAISNNQDPHTDYLPPKDKQRFDEVMSGSFFGIGAQLKDEEGKIKIAAVIAGSPSWKQGELKAGDEIIKVAQGKEEAVDIQGFDIDDAVKLIRGKKGTEVRLTVKKADGSTKIVPIMRDKVELEETFAKSVILESNDGPVGYIYLPEFYADFQKINGRRCAEDVAIEVQKLKNAGITGLILDLRNNGGGSLDDVVKMAGLFIDQGPVVQVKTSGAMADKLNDDIRGVLYDGPLAIMVNQNSASASEILAAAMQDYKRAVVVGSTTFGKGTVQRLISLDDKININLFADINPHEVLGEVGIGAIKLTVQKFYRVNGGSTQLKGVTPDINLPDLYQGIDWGERRDKAALKWDEIPAADYRPVTNPINTKELALLSIKRVTTNPAFSLIEESAKRIEKREKSNVYSLNEKVYTKEVEEANATSKKMEELEKKSTPLSIKNVQDDLAHINRDSTTIKKNEDWIKNLQKDIYIFETVNIVNDITKMQTKVNIDTGMKK